MAAVTRRAKPSWDNSTAAVLPQIVGLLAEETLPACSPCAINPSTGKVRLASTTNGFDGFNMVDARADEAVTLTAGPGLRIGLADSGLTTRALLYLSAVAGELNDTVAGTPVARVINATDIRVIAVAF